MVDLFAVQYDYADEVISVYESKALAEAHRDMLETAGYGDDVVVKPLVIQQKVPTLLTYFQVITWNWEIAESTTVTREPEKYLEGVYVFATKAEAEAAIPALKSLAAKIEANDELYMTESRRLREAHDARRAAIEKTLFVS